MEVAPEGYFHFEKLIGQSAASSQGFVAMWFGEPVKLAYETGLAPAIINAGYDPRRMDDIDHVGPHR
jgi:hypothetical protein